MNGYARLVRQMMNEHGLQDWKIAWTRAKKTHGLCCYSIKTLKFSAVAFAHIPEEEVVQTILHEIAHALAGSVAGHGPAWVRVLRSIGGTGGQYVSREAAQAIPTAWEGRCPAGHTTGQHRAPLRVKACGKCSRVYRPENVYRWYHHGRAVGLGGMPQRYVTEVVSMRRTYGDRMPI